VRPFLAAAAAAIAGVCVMSLTSVGRAAEPQAALLTQLGSPAPAPAPSPSSSVAQIAGVNVSMEELQRPLIEGYGLNVLLNLVQLDLAKQGAGRAGVTVSPADIAHEREDTLMHVFEKSNEKLTDKMNALRAKGDTAGADKIAEQIKHDNEAAFDQYMQQQHLSRAEWEIVTETNAYLRKIAEPMLIGKISEDNLHAAFNALYGETVECRHIQCSNMQEIQEVKKRLDGGDPFAMVAQDLSRNAKTARAGGKLPAFSRDAQGLPQEFKDAAFSLKEGQVSEVVLAEGAFHLILLEKRNPPKVVKFEDVKDAIRADLQDRAVQATVLQLRGQLAEQIRNGGLVINDPVLKKQWQDRQDQAKAKIKDQTAMRKQWEAERERAATQPASAPDLAPAAPSLTPAK
jgi:parvulin-like peptidyl-prolyl isomerase